MFQGSDTAEGTLIQTPLSATLAQQIFVCRLSESQGSHRRGFIDLPRLLWMWLISWTFEGSISGAFFFFKCWLHCDSWQGWSKFVTVVDSSSPPYRTCRARMKLKPLMWFGSPFLFPRHQIPTLCHRGTHVSESLLRKTIPTLLDAKRKCSVCDKVV